MPFTDVEEKRPVLLITFTPAWNTVKDQLKGLNIAETIEVIETTTEYWDILEAKTKKRYPLKTRGIRFRG